MVWPWKMWGKPSFRGPRKWGVRSVVVEFGVFGAPRFSVQRSQNPLEIGIWGPLDWKAGRPKNAKSYHDGSDPPFAALWFFKLTPFYRDSKENRQFGGQKSKSSMGNFRGDFPPPLAFGTFWPPHPGLWKMRETFFRERNPEGQRHTN